MVVYREMQSIEWELGFEAATLYGISNSIPRHYRKIKIPKRSGGFRTLSVPDEVLKRVQRAIADKLLSYEPVSEHARAYRVAASVKKNAAPHVGASQLLKLDIKDFFDSVLYSTVKEKVFPAVKYSEPIRILLSMLCYFGDKLPQGAPTSPAITNIIMRDFDCEVGKWCAARKIKYTRYCDDMSFSGEFNREELVDFVRERLRAEGYFLNEGKTVYATSSQRRTVTGIVVNEKLSVPVEYRRKIRSEVFYCKKYGVLDHLSRLGSTATPEKYLQGLLGRINYVLQITPDNTEFISYKYDVLNLLKS